MDIEKFSEIVEKLLEKDSRYARAAYFFVHEGLEYSVKKLSENPGRRRHTEAGNVTAHEIVEGVVEHAMEQFGPLAATLMRQWGLNGAEDVGAVVYALVEAGILGKAQGDSRDDFKNETGDFLECLRAPFTPREDTRRLHADAVRFASTVQKVLRMKNFNEKTLAEKERRGGQDVPAEHDELAGWDESKDAPGRAKPRAAKSIAQKIAKPEKKGPAAVVDSSAGGLGAGVSSIASSNNVSAAKPFKAGKSSKSVKKGEVAPKKTNPKPSKSRKKV
ncbi:MAG: hypothetical protein LBG65_02825 [Puniceicoccales bacterium]|jgi:uncharacterized repeat protein (TIGR04138 family)|nr:hypothetical protein [Puniceicoccales bacterium]